MSYEKNLKPSEDHAVFSPSQSAWLRYDKEQIINRLCSVDAKRLGTELHEFAKAQIDLRIKARSCRGLTDSFATYIYRKYYDDEIEFVSKQGEKILQSISRIPKPTICTLQSYINDCIGFCMTTEQCIAYDLVYFFGTMDAHCYRDDILRISDLKTGVTPAKMEQLLIYAALYCLSKKIQPKNMKRIELRIYQGDKIIYHEPTPTEVEDIMKIIIEDYKIACEYERSFAR